MIVDITKPFHESKGPEFSDRIVAFSEKHLSYYPQTMRFYHKETSAETIVLVFQSEEDAMLFKVLR